MDDNLDKTPQPNLHPILFPIPEINLPPGMSLANFSDSSQIEPLQLQEYWY